MKKLMIAVSMFALMSCATTSNTVGNDWPSHAKEMAAVTLQNFKEHVKDLPVWLQDEATQVKMAECLSKKASHLIEGLCAPYDVSKSTRDNLMTACAKSAVISFAAAEAQQMCVNALAPQVLP